MKKAAKIILKGSVKNIFFRNFIKDHADSLGLKGFVRNLEDASVEIFVEGDIESVDEMFERCRAGNKHTQIRNAVMNETSFQDFKEFKILNI
ncbi:MAG TPA: acylphosphatase [Candidatus Nanoarchaeia archaeon]|nr:acylphosphatase [Candidatus Nanoarchaeia archaeon]